MTSLPVALSLTSSFTKIGAIAGLAAVIGVAILSLLVFSQARELKRLREWAGRAPERAADLEQRVSTAASARVQQQAPGVAAARPVPRTT
ncbi:MAG: LytR family transcriptional regulator, partial [Solirubrobacterales bacterium]|nr:LytR family transcriptional regulator [Solirubrobacterales bacterium]